MQYIYDIEETKYSGEMEVPTLFDAFGRLLQQQLLCLFSCYPGSSFLNQ